MSSDYHPSVGCANARTTDPGVGGAVTETFLFWGPYARPHSEPKPSDPSYSYDSPNDDD